jgi:hypothetical protein
MRLKNSVVKNNRVFYPDNSTKPGEPPMNDNEDTRENANECFLWLRKCPVPANRTDQGKDYAAASVMIDYQYSGEEITAAIRHYYETTQPDRDKEEIKAYAEERYSKALKYWEPPKTKTVKHPVEVHYSNGTGGYL